MRGERVRLLVPLSLLILILLVLASCATVPSRDIRKEDPPIAKKETKREPASEKKKPEPEEKKDVPSAPYLEEDAGSIKGGIQEAETPVKRRDPGKTEPARFEKDPVLELQKRRVADFPASDVEKMKLAILYALNKDFPEAEGLLTSLRTRSHALLPFVEAYIFRMLGEHKASTDRIRKIIREASVIEGFKIDQYALCSRISGYRRFKENGPGQVKPGGIALVYVEPRNFRLEREKDGYKLWLEYDWKLYNDRMEEIPVPVWKKARPADKQDVIRFQGPVQEFYQSFRLPLPSNLPLGDYRIKVTVTDRNLQRSDSQYIPLRVPAVK